MTTKDDTDALTVYYDGDCPLCRFEIDHYRSRKGADAIRFVDAAQPGTDLGDDLHRDIALGRFHVRHGDGTLTSGAAGFIALWAKLPGWRVVARLAGLPGIRHMLELAYRMFLPIRPYISRAVGRLSR